MPRPEVLELGDQDVLCTKFSEAGDAIGGAASKVTGAGTEKLNLRNTPAPASEAWASFRGCCLALLYCLPVISNLRQLGLLQS